MVLDWAVFYIVAPSSKYYNELNNQLTKLDDRIFSLIKDEASYRSQIDNIADKLETARRFRNKGDEIWDKIPVGYDSCCPRVG